MGKSGKGRELKQRDDNERVRGFRRRDKGRVGGTETEDSIRLGVAAAVLWIRNRYFIPDQDPTSVNCRIWIIRYGMFVKKKDLNKI
jgi:hypothetical protein